MQYLFYLHFIKIINTVLITVFVFAAFNIGKIYYDYNKADNIYEVMQDEYVATKDVESNSEATQGNDEQQSYYDQHPIMYYLTLDGNYKLELFAGLVVKRDDKIYLPNQSEEEFAELIEEYRAKSTFKSDIELEYNDTIVTLSPAHTNLIMRDIL